MARSAGIGFGVCKADGEVNDSTIQNSRPSAVKDTQIIFADAMEYLKEIGVTLHNGNILVNATCVPADVREDFAACIVEFEQQLPAHKADFYPQKWVQQLVDPLLYGYVSDFTYRQESNLTLESADSFLLSCESCKNRPSFKDIRFSATLLPLYAKLGFCRDSTPKFGTYINGLHPRKTGNIYTKLETVIKYFVPALEVARGRRTNHSNERLYVHVLQSVHLPVAVAITTFHIAAGNYGRSSRNPKYCTSMTLAWLFHSENVQLPIHLRDTGIKMDLGAFVIWSANDQFRFRSEDAKLIDNSKPGAVRILTLYIGNRRANTTDFVAPQRREWYTAEGGDEAAILLERKFGTLIGTSISEFLINLNNNMINEQDALMLRKSS